jgi:prepilin-type N-terminal cleavage/methylation domain-containing protein/prepilin-type processing-associated H-X9-DG protein
VMKPLARFRCPVRDGFTLIELLIVVFIISLLLQMMLPAVEMARESARQTQCRNNLKQIALAFQLHETAQRRFPSGGWDHRWVGEPERGTNIDQPGGWVFNILDYIEAQPVRSAGRGLTGEERAQALLNRCMTPIELLNCPSRRLSRVYRQTKGVQARGLGGVLPLPFKAGAKIDYAASTGSAYDIPSVMEIGWKQPATLEEGDDPDFLWYIDEEFVGQNGRKPIYNGIVFGRSRVELGQVTDGASNTYLVGEKYLPMEKYKTGDDAGDNENMYNGFNDDTCRAAYYAPLRDEVRTANNQFGSAHPGGWNMAFVDGSVREISYDIYLQVHRDLASRDGSEIVSIAEAF